MKLFVCKTVHFETLPPHQKVVGMEGSPGWMHCVSICPCIGINEDITTRNAQLCQLSVSKSKESFSSALFSSVSPPKWSWVAKGAAFLPQRLHSLTKIIRGSGSRQARSKRKEEHSLRETAFVHNWYVIIPSKLLIKYFWTLMNPMSQNVSISDNPNFGDGIVENECRYKTVDGRWTNVTATIYDEDPEEPGIRFISSHHLCIQFPF